MILQTVRNECVRFGGHVDIEVSHKILRLDVLKDTPSKIHLALNRGCFEAVLMKNTPRTLGVNIVPPRQRDLHLCGLLCQKSY
jgi:hypothetical protein